MRVQYRLIAVNVFQICVAIASNIILLLNMAQKIKYTIAHPLNIAG